MLETLEIHRFRGIEYLKLENLARVNIFLGGNGAGKTSVLEAVSLAANPTAPVLLNTLGLWREMPHATASQTDSLLSAFMDLDPTNNIEFDFQTAEGAQSLIIEASRGLSVEHDAARAVPLPSTGANSPGNGLLGVRYRWETTGGLVVDSSLDLNPNGFVIRTPPGAPSGDGAFFVHTRRSTSAAETASTLTNLYEHKQQKAFVDGLCAVDPRLKNMVVGARQNLPVVLVDIGRSKLVPMNLLGDGFCRVALMLTGMFAAQAKIVCIDEIDSGLYATVMESTWRSLAKFVGQQNRQIFCTTHNEEMLRHAVVAFEESPDGLRVFRIDRDDSDATSVQTFTYDEFADSLRAGLDVR